MKRVKFVMVVLIALMVIVGLGFVGCASMLELDNQLKRNAPNSGSGRSSGSGSSSSANNMVVTYQFNNYSSYDVTLSDSTGRLTVPRGRSAEGRFSKAVSISDVYFEPADNVSVTLYGTTFAFRDK